MNALPVTPYPQSEAVETRSGTLEFTHDFADGYPTEATVDKLYQERDGLPLKERNDHKVVFDVADDAYVDVERHMQAALARD